MSGLYCQKDQSNGSSSMVHYLDQPLDPIQAPLCASLSQYLAVPKDGICGTMERRLCLDSVATEKKMEEQKPSGEPSAWDLFLIPVFLGLILNRTLMGFL